MSQPNAAALDDEQFICLVTDDGSENASLVQNANDNEVASNLDDESEDASPDNKPMLGLVWKKSSLWPEGKRFLKVKFLGDVSPYPNTLKRIKEFIEVDYTGPVVFWSQVCFINFQIVPPDEDAEIRIAMLGDRRFSSAVGVVALDYPQDERTMSLGFDRDDYSDEYVYRAVLHEFGHAIGFQHEHQSPQRTFEYDKAKVTQDMKAMGWTDEQIQTNIFDKVTVDPNSMDMIYASAFDASSIMEYSMDASWLTNYGGQGITEKNVLSATDIVKASQAYYSF